MIGQHTPFRLASAIICFGVAGWLAQVFNWICLNIPDPLLAIANIPLGFINHPIGHAYANHTFFTILFFILLIVTIHRQFEPFNLHITNRITPRRMVQ